MLTMYAATKAEQELDWNVPDVILDEEMFRSTLRKSAGPNDPHGWSDPGAKGFMVRSRTYNDDSLKVCIAPLPDGS